MTADSAITGCVLRWRFFRDALESGDHARELAVAAEYPVGTHHHQPLDPVSGDQTDRAVRRREGLVESHQHSTPRPAHSTSEDLLAVFAKHLPRGHA